jgi:glycerophosphoryl diester phosphodiesterase
VTFLSGPLPRIIAHRGLATEAPENTLLAFLRALNAGATHLETDVHVSADGVAVISHDPDLSRVAGRAVRIEQLTMAELRRIDLGEGQSFVSLADALDALPDVLFNIDIKSDEAGVPAARAILDARAEHRVLIASFSSRRALLAAALIPDVARSASSRRVALAVLGARLGWKTLVLRATSGIDAVQLPERYRFVRLVTARSVRGMHEAGVEVHVWTVNDPEAMRRLLDAGVDGLITDRTDVAREVIGRRS